MSTALVDRWIDMNQQTLVAALATVRDALERHVGTASPDSALERGPSDNAPRPAPDESALDAMAAAFGLSPFERLVVVLAAGPELDGTFSALCGRANGDSSRSFPTFGLALAALPGAHWSALSPDGPLRRWRLVVVEPGNPLAGAPLRLDERVLHHLTGIGGGEPELRGVLSTLSVTIELQPSQADTAARVAEVWRTNPSAPEIVVQLLGSSRAAKRAVAAAASSSLGLHLAVVDARALPGDVRDVVATARLLEREAVLSHVALVIDADDTDEPDRVVAVALLADELMCPFVVATRDRRANRSRPSLALDVALPTPDEQTALWERHAPGAPLEALVTHFDLDASTISAVAATADGGLWPACRAQARLALGPLTNRIEPVARLSDVVLPAAQQELLRRILLHVRHRRTVYDRWGLGATHTRGLGTAALFAGPSGTGKTLAAEALAHELDLDLHRVDLSAVIDKYIGETEKHLRKIFDAADAGGAVLLFDEADALFGKRSEVRDSHDRYANIEVSYLLQRIEDYRGLAILTTNMKDALDQAFLRRLRFVVDFPFPTRAARAEIWRGIFPATAPTDGLDAEALSLLNVSGGTIRNIAVGGAFLAADDGAAISMRHVLDAARIECAKLDQPVPMLSEPGS